LTLRVSPIEFTRRKGLILEAQYSGSAIHRFMLYAV
jgi:hypothetical protein